MTKVYGASDDLIEFAGDIHGEVNAYGTDDRDRGVLLVFSDGTLLEIKYGKADSAIWGITIVKKGDLFDTIDACTEETDKRYSDFALFHDGLKWAYACKTWERVK